MKLKIFCALCAIGMFAYVFITFCESVQDNGMLYTFHYCLRILFGLGLGACFFAGSILYIDYIPKHFLKRIKDDGSLKARLFSVLYIIIYIILVISAIKGISLLSDKYDSYISFQKFMYRIERNIDNE